MSDELRQGWVEFCEDLKGAVDYIFDPDQPGGSTEQAEGVRHVLRMLTRAVHTRFENGDVLHPELGWSYPSKMGQDNPDALYQSAPLDLTHSYRLSGNIGTVSYLGLSFMSFDFGKGPIEQLLTINATDLGADANGDFTATFSSRPASVDAGVWFELPPKKTTMLVRQFFSNWATEVPADMYIECLDAERTDTRLEPADVIARLAGAVGEASFLPSYWNGYYRAHIDRGHINHFAPVEATDPGEVESLGGSVEQAYGECWYDVGPEDALIYEVTIPECAYWNVQVGDLWGQSTDWVNHQSSLNGAQAVLDDGTFRAVLAHCDPGIANWIDLGGVTQGPLTYRWNQADTAPVPTLTLVAFADIADHLPAGVATVTPAERARQLRDRRRHALRRFRR